ncbi:MAG: hypothetical protein WBD92_02435, partial [Methylovirgula sp.]
AHDVGVAELWRRGGRALRLQAVNRQPQRAGYEHRSSEERTGKKRPGEKRGDLAAGKFGHDP